LFYQPEGNARKKGKPAGAGRDPQEERCSSGDDGSSDLLTKEFLKVGWLKDRERKKGLRKGVETVETCPLLRKESLVKSREGGPSILVVC